MTDIQFGEVEYQGPEVSARPDQDAHFSVVECGDCREDDLAIYVDLDVLRDMEGHARSNTDVELGGVMLGGQFHDHDGKPFVVVTDSLRAEHFEATKGSFKFTHETWQEITRRRQEFAEDLQMVGWYHTHPDWGVFLSGMDLFICDHFFNRPLDVALVIDPCRGDRGWFQWAETNPPKTRETNGFYLITNRFREDELNFFRNLYSGEGIMATDPRYSGAAGSIVQPIVNINDQRTPIVNIAIMGMLTIQLLVLALMGYKLVANDQTESDKKLAAVENQLLAIGKEEQLQTMENAYSQVIQAMAKDDSSVRMATEFVDIKSQWDQLQGDLRGQRVLAVQAEVDRDAAVKKYDKTSKELENKQRALETAQQTIQDYKKLVGEDGKLVPIVNWVYLAGAGILGILGLAGGYWLGGKDLAKDNHERGFDHSERTRESVDEDEFEPRMKIDDDVHKKNDDSIEIE